MKSLFYVICLVFGTGFLLPTSSCNHPLKPMNDKIQYDSIPRPTGISPDAVLMNFGGSELPVYAWVEIVGFYKNNSLSFSHIIGVKYYYPENDKVNTIYYENSKLRSGSLGIELGTCKILPSYSTVDLLVKSGSDTLHFFPVLEVEDLRDSYEKVEYSRFFSVKKNMEGDLFYAGDVSISIVSRNGLYDVRFNRKNNAIFTYKIYPKNDSKITKISFLDKSDGNIYLIEKGCYLEPLEKDKVLLEADWE